MGYTIRMNNVYLGVIWATRFERVEEEKYVFYDERENIIAILNGITVVDD